MGVLKDWTLAALVFAIVVVGASMFSFSTADSVGKTIDNVSDNGVISGINEQTRQIGEALNQTTIQGNIWNLPFTIPSAVFNFFRLIFLGIPNMMAGIIMAATSYFLIPPELVVLILAGVGISVGYAIFSAITKTNP